MQRFSRFLVMGLGLGLIVLGSMTLAQPGQEQPKTEPKTNPAVEGYVARLMAFDSNKDGKLSRDELTDERLLRLYDRIDTKKAGFVTRADIVAVATRELAAGPVGPGGPGPGFPGGPGGPGKDAPMKDAPMRDGFGKNPFGKGTFGRPQPGQVLPTFVQDRLQLTEEQKKQVEKIQQEVDSRLEKMLTDEQKKLWKEMKEGGPRP